MNEINDPLLREAYSSSQPSENERPRLQVEAPTAPSIPLSARKITKPFFTIEKVIGALILLTLVCIILCFIAHPHLTLFITLSVVGTVAIIATLIKRSRDIKAELKERAFNLTLNQEQFAKMLQYNRGTPSAGHYIKPEHQKHRLVKDRHDLGSPLEMYDSLKAVPPTGVYGEKILIRIKERPGTYCCYERRCNSITNRSTLILVMKDIPLIYPHQNGSITVTSSIIIDQQKLGQHRVFTTKKDLGDFLHREGMGGVYVINDRIHHIKKGSNESTCIPNVNSAQLEPNGMYKFTKYQPLQEVRENPSMIPHVEQDENGYWIVPREMVMPDETNMPTEYDLPPA